MMLTKTDRIVRVSLRGVTAEQAESRRNLAAESGDPMVRDGRSTLPNLVIAGFLEFYFHRSEEKIV